MNKIIVITGASSGIGKGLKEKFEKDNDIVINLSIDAKNTTDNLNFCCDVADGGKVEEIFKIIGEKFGNIDILINCAGYAVNGATELISLESAKKQFDVNFFGTLQTCRLAIPLMKNGCKIINISSACAFSPVPFRTLYCASKSAVSMLSECLRMELKHLDIEVAHICPGDIKTNFSKNRVKVYDTNERYGTRIENTLRSIEEREHKRMDCDYVVNKLYKIITKKHLKTMYVINGKTKLFYLARKFASRKLYNNVSYKLFGGQK